jgi:DNA mismatch repair ATPase MutL
LIWNSPDADARKVKVSSARNDLDGIDEIRVEDDGHGMTRADAEEAFAASGLPGS